MSTYRLIRQCGAPIGPAFSRYVDAFNYRAAIRVPAMIIEERAK